MNSLALHPAHLEDLRRSGLSDETIRAAGIYTVPPDEIGQKKSQKGLPDGVVSALAFPYPGCDGFERYKVWWEEGKQDKAPRYLQKTGTPNHLYSPPEVDLAGDGFLTICEGEKKTLALNQAGIPAVGIGGVWNWCQRGEGYRKPKESRPIGDLDPNVTLKPSGIDWLGDIPTRWRAVRLKYVSRVQTGITLGKNYMGQQVEERPYLRVANVQTSRLDMRMVKTVAVPPSEIVRSELKPGDVLMTEGGDIDKLGRGCVWQGEIEGCLHQNHIFAVRADQSRLLPDYLMALMASRLGRVYFQLTAKQTTNLASTNSSTLGAFPLVLPEVKEQRQILDAIGKKTFSLDAAIDRAQSEIDLIREYRTRLIADMVTGKVDVRHLAPETVEAAPEDLDEGLYDEAPEDDETELAQEETDADD